MTLTSRFAYARRCLVLAALSMVIPRTAALSQSTAADSASAKRKSEAPFLAFSIGILSAPIDSSRRDSWRVTQFTFIPKRWPRWEVGLVGHAGSGSTTASVDPAANVYYSSISAAGTSVLLGHRWSPFSFLRLGVRGTAGSLETRYNSCRYSAMGCVHTDEKSRIGVGSIETLAEFKLWRWVHADINAGYRKTGRPSAPVPLTSPTLSGFTWGYTLRLGNFP